MDGDCVLKKNAENWFWFSPTTAKYERSQATDIIISNMHISDCHRASLNGIRRRKPRYGFSEKKKKDKIQIQLRALPCQPWATAASVLFSNMIFAYSVWYADMYVCHGFIFNYNAMNNFFLTHHNMHHKKIILLPDWNKICVCFWYHRNGTCSARKYQKGSIAGRDKRTTYTDADTRNPRGQFRVFSSIIFFRSFVRCEEVNHISLQNKTK